MNTEDEEFERIEREISRRAQQDDDTMCYQSELNAAVLAEREACALLCDQLSDSLRDLQFGDAIRERGQA